MYTLGYDYFGVFEEDIFPSVQVLSHSDGSKVITLHSVSENKTWMLDGNGEILNGFPVKGNTDSVIESFSSDQKSYLVIGSSDGNLYVYLIR